MNLKLDTDLLARVDAAAAAAGQTRTAYLERAASAYLGGGGSAALAPAAPSAPRPARAMTSAQARSGVRPRPKGKA